MEAKEFNKLITEYKTDRKSFNKLYDYYYPKITFHIGIKFSKDIAEDVAQEFFVKLFKTEINYYIESPNAWVYTVADNIAKSYIVKNKPFVEFKGDECVEFVTDVYDKETVAAVFKNLDDTDKAIFGYHYFEGYSLKEIAPMLQMTYESVKKRHVRALKKLKSLKIDF